MVYRCVFVLSMVRFVTTGAAACAVMPTASLNPPGRRFIAGVRVFIVSSNICGTFVADGAIVKHGVEIFS